MVRVAVASPRTAPIGLESVTITVSSPSKLPSPLMVTAACALVAPAGMTTPPVIDW